MVSVFPVLHDSTHKKLLVFPIFNYLQLLVLTRDLKLVYNSIFQLSIVAQDKGYPPLTDRATARVYVQRNLNPPRFSQNTYRVNITENNPVNSEVLSVRATDADGVRTL